MDKTEKYMLVAFVGLVIFIIQNAESCEDKGGESKFTHMLMIPTKIGNTTIMQQIPQYKCVLINK